MNYVIKNSKFTFNEFVKGKLRGLSLLTIIQSQQIGFLEVFQVKIIFFNIILNGYILRIPISCFCP